MKKSIEHIERVALERFHNYIYPEPNTGCWLWAGTISTHGYGITYVNYKRYFAHRFSYEVFKGKIPDGLVIDHLCNTRLCVNPDHLNPTTSRENTMRSSIAPASINKRKTHCKNGHPFTPDNTARFKKGWRECKICASALSKKYRLNKKTAEA